MNRRTALSALAVAPLASAKAKGPPARKKFVGVWKLVSCEYRNKATGEISHPFGSAPVGRITYDEAGRMSAQLMNPGRPAAGGPNTRGMAAVIRAASAEDIREMLTGFIAYFGTFDVEESSQTGSHHVQCCLIPNWVGTDLRRSYEFTASGRLILIASLEQSNTRLVWEREAA